MSQSKKKIDHINVIILSYWTLRTKARTVQQDDWSTQRNATTTCIEDKDCNIIMDKDNIRTHWFEYISEIYKDVDDNYHILSLIQLAFLLLLNKFSIH